VRERGGIQTLKEKKEKKKKRFLSSHFLQLNYDLIGALFSSGTNYCAFCKLVFDTKALSWLSCAILLIAMFKT
jgi:hypothetical protein